MQFTKFELAAVQILAEEFTAANSPSAKSCFRTWKEGCLSVLDHCVMTHPFRARERVYVASY